MSKLALNCKVVASYPESYTKNGWKEISSKLSKLNNGNEDFYQVITLQKHSRPIAKICLAVFVVFLSLGLVFAFPTSKSLVEQWWAGMEHQKKFALLTELKAVNKVIAQEIDDLQEFPAIGIVISAMDYLTMEEILKDDREKLQKQALNGGSHLMQLPVDIFNKVGFFVDLKDLGHLAQTSKLGCCIASENNKPLWESVAESLDTLDAGSTKSAKQKVKDSLFISLPEADIDFVNHKIFIKNLKSINQFEHKIYKKYIPKDFYVLFNYLRGNGSEAAFISERILYWDDEGFFQIYVPGGECDETLSFIPGEDERIRHFLASSREQLEVINFPSNLPII